MTAIWKHSSNLEWARQKTSETNAIDKVEKLRYKFQADNQNYFSFKRKFFAGLISHVSAVKLSLIREADSSFKLQPIRGQIVYLRLIFLFILLFIRTWMIRSNAYDCTLDRCYLSVRLLPRCLSLLHTMRSTFYGVDIYISFSTLRSQSKHCMYGGIPHNLPKSIKWATGMRLHTYE